MMFSRFSRVIGRCLTGLYIWSVTLAVYAQTTQSSIKLLEPFEEGKDTLKICESAIKTWMGYWYPAVQWAFDVGLGLSTLWMVWGAILVATSGLNESNRANGFGVMKAALGSLLLFVFAGSVLSFLNNIYFTSGSTPTC